MLPVPLQARFMEEAMSFPARIGEAVFWTLMAVGSGVLLIAASVFIIMTPPNERFALATPPAIEGFPPPFPGR
jgi:hypothetical protein